VFFTNRAGAKASPMGLKVNQGDLISWGSQVIEEMAALPVHVISACQFFWAVFPSRENFVFTVIGRSLNRSLSSFCFLRSSENIGNLDKDFFIKDFLCQFQVD
jgi:hypothetical protein